MSNNTIKILYTHFSTRLSDRSWNIYFCKLPEAIQVKINRYRRWQDRHSGLLGKLLLIECLKEYGYGPDYLNNISFDECGRPFIDNSIDFNIAHSDKCVVCAILHAGRVGIDIEKIRPIDVSELRHYITQEEVRDIEQAPNRYRRFFEYWTIKESVLKADGRGLSIDLAEVHIQGKRATLWETTWFLRVISIHSDHTCHLATNLENPKICLKEVEFK